MADRSITMFTKSVEFKEVQASYGYNGEKRMTKFANLGGAGSR